MNVMTMMLLTNNSRPTLIRAAACELPIYSSSNVFFCRHNNILFANALQTLTFFIKRILLEGVEHVCVRYQNCRAIFQSCQQQKNIFQKKVI